jgi:hypothetical protein
MEHSRKLAAALVAALGLGVSAAASAHPGQMGGGMGPQARDSAQDCMRGSGVHGPRAGGRMGGLAQQLMTPEERQAVREKMRNAATPEERRQIAEATRAELQKRAQEKGIALPEHHGRFRERTETPAAPQTQSN